MNRPMMGGLEHRPTGMLETRHQLEWRGVAMLLICWSIARRVWSHSRFTARLFRSALSRRVPSQFINRVKPVSNAASTPRFNEKMEINDVVWCGLCSCRLFVSLHCWSMQCQERQLIKVGVRAIRIVNPSSHRWSVLLWTRQWFRAGRRPSVLMITRDVRWRCCPRSGPDLSIEILISPIVSVMIQSVPIYWLPWSPFITFGLLYRAIVLGSVPTQKPASNIFEGRHVKTWLVA